MIRVAHSVAGGGAPAAPPARTRTRRFVAECGVVAVLFAVIDVTQYLLGQSPLALDVLTSNMPLKHMAIRQWALGHLPLWDSGAGHGVPVLADSIALPLDPRNLWFAVLDRADAYVAVIVTGKVAGALTCFAWLRRGHRLTFLAAVAGTATYLWSTMFLAEFRLHSTEVVIALFPAVVWLTERLLARPGPRRAAALGALWAVLALTGSVAYLLYPPVLALLWGLALWAGGGRDRRVLRRFVGWYLGAGALGAALAAVALLPTLELLLHSNRGGEYVSDPFWSRSLLFALLGAHRPSPLVPAYSHFLYVGVVGLALVAVASARRTTPALRALPLLGLASTVGIVAMLTPLKPRAVEVVPQLATIPFFRLTFFPGLVVAFLVAEALSRRSWQRTAGVRAVAGGLALLQAGVLFGLLVAFAVVTVLRWEDAWRHGEVTERLAFLRPAWSLWVGVLVALRLAGTVLVLRGGGPLLPRRPRLPRIEVRQVVGVLVIAELALAWATVRALQPGGDDPFPRTSEVAFLQARSGLDHRMAQLNPWPEWGPPIPDPTGLASSSLASDAPVMHGLATSTLYESLMNRDIARVYKGFPLGTPRGRATASLLLTSAAGSGLWDALGVRYLSSRQELPDLPGLRLVHSGVAYHVYERLDAVPRAYVTGAAERLPRQEVFARLDAIGSGERASSELRDTVLLTAGRRSGVEGSPGGYSPARVVLDEGSRVEVAVDSPGPGWLVLSDTLMPGWRADVGGRPEAVEQANGFARAVRVPEGRSTVTFTYRPASVRWGAWISATTAAALAAAFVNARRRRAASAPPPAFP